MKNSIPHNVFPAEDLPPDSLLPWLQPNFRPQTDMLLELSGDASLKLLSQSWTDTNIWEMDMLDLDKERIFRREIIMHSHNKPCWYARTMIPQTCFDLDKPFFEKLYTGPLTPLVFNEPKVHRKQFFYYALNENCQEYYWIHKAMHLSKGPLWARYSEYLFAKKSCFYLVEILLPDLMRLTT